MKIEAKTFYEGPANDDYDRNINWVEHAPSLLPAATRQRFDSAAMQIYKKIDGEKTFNNAPTYWTSHIKVQSAIIIEHLESILAGSDVVFGQRHVDIRWPFQPLYFAWSEIEKACANAKQDQDPEEGLHLGVLWKFMGDELLETFQRVSTLRREGRISYDLLWALFPQGSFVMSTANGYQQAYRVLSCGRDAKGDNARESERAWSIRCEFMQYDGYEYGYSEAIFDLQHFFDTKPITTLRIYPWSHVHGGDSLRRKLTERGRAVLEFQGRDFRFYDGIALEPQEKTLRQFGDYQTVWTRTKFNVSVSWAYYEDCLNH